MEFQKRRRTYRGGDLEVMVHLSRSGHPSGSGDSQAAVRQ